MSGTPYFDQDERDEIQRAKNSGKSDEFLAGNVGCSVEELCRLMEWPQWKQLPPQQATADFCLFEGSERLDGVL